WRYTTSLHTRFLEYVRARVPQFPLRWGYAALARFHGDAAVTLVASEGMRGELAARGFDHLNVWRRGVDTRLFTPGAAFDPGLPRPLYLYVGRVAREKNIEAFLELPLAGAKAVVGDGPDRARLERAWPQVVFAGYRRGHDLAAWYASADALVFPSRTDTYGVVMLEALACGTPVAAYPVTGPADIVRPGVTGQLDEDLARAGEGCLSLSRAACAAFAREHDWAAVVGEFLARTVPVTPAAACD
ncbi:MAG: glycosyltransferase, partial [Halofilum sp. (in: g-proteobacteria)]